MATTGPTRTPATRPEPGHAARRGSRRPTAMYGSVRSGPPLRSDTRKSSAVLPAITMACVGLLLQCTGYSIGWANRTGALPFFYVGLALIGLPCAAILFGSSASRVQRIVVGLTLAMLLYLSFLLTSPLFPTRFDETLHVASLRSLLTGHTLFVGNSMLPIGPYYPGMELMASAVHWLTGLPLTACEVVVVVIARVVLVLALFHIAERCTRSARAAGIAVLLYACTSQFYFFNAQFAYQTLAIAFTLSLIWLTQKALDAERARLWISLAVAVGAALTITHHLTSWITLVAMLAWTLALVRRGDRRPRRIVGGVTLALGVQIVGWTSLVGSRLYDYLQPLFNGAQSQLDSILRGTGKSRKLLTDPAGSKTPMWEEAMLIGSMLVWMCLIAVAGWSALRGRKVLGQGRLVWLAVATSASYPALLGARLSPVASNIADRASTFIFFPVVIVVAAWLVGQLRRVHPIVPLAGFLVLLIGGTILGSGPDWERVPGPYLVAAQQRSVDAASVNAARWADQHLPAGATFASDFALQAFLPDFADLKPITNISGLANVASLFFADKITAQDVDLIKSEHIDFVFLDTRLANAAPRAGAYFEPNVLFDSLRITKAQIDKFETTPGFLKIFDGPIRVYDVRSISGSGVGTDPSRNTDPGRADGWQMLIFGVLAVGALATLAVRRMRSDQVLAALGVASVGLIAIGLIGLTTGFSRATGSEHLVVLAGIGAWLIWKTGPRPFWHRPTLRGLDVAAAVNVTVAAMIVVLSVYTATTAAHEALFPTVPVGGPVAGALR